MSSILTTVASVMRSRTRHPKGDKRTQTGDLVSLTKVPTTNMMTCRQHTINIPYVTSSTSPQFGSVPFDSTAFTQFASLATVFDQWRIVDLEFKFNPRTNVVADNSFVNAANAGEFITAFDYDGNIPGAITDILDYDSAVTVPGYRSVVRRTKPSTLTTVFNGSTANAVMPEFGKWLAVGGTSTKYYSIVWAWTPAVNTSYAYDMIVTAVLQFRYVR